MLFDNIRQRYGKRILIVAGSAAVLSAAAGTALEIHAAAAPSAPQTPASAPATATPDTPDAKEPASKTPDTDNVQDQSGVDQKDAAGTQGAADETEPADAATDGPGGFADPAGSAGAQDQQGEN
jgi:hypothetical protein